MRVKNTEIPFYEKFSLVLVGLISLGYLVILSKDILDPLVFGFLFSILLLPIARFVENRLRMPRGIAAVCAILLLIAFIGGILYVVGAQVSSLAGDLPTLKSQVSQSLDDLSQWIQQGLHINAHKQMVYLHSTTKKIMDSGGTVVGQTFGAVSSLMLFYVFIVVFTFLILFYRSVLYRFILWAFADEYSPVVNDVAENIQSILRQYILGLLLEMLVVACLACGAFWVIGIKYAVLLGLIVAIFNLIPYIGIFTALLLSCLITFATGNISQVFYVAVSVIGIHIVDSNLLLPTIVGSKVKLNALISFLGIVSGEMIWGLSGMFLSIPMMAIFKIIFDRVESLKPWGYLMGSGQEEKKTVVKRMRPKKEDET